MAATTGRLAAGLETRLGRLAHAVVDDDRAHIAVRPTRSSDGFWFGGGNCVRDADGSLLLIGRYRDAGDSRTGLAAGPRGRELALFRSVDDGDRFDKILAWSKAQIGGPSPVLSIEGSALRIAANGRAEVLVSTERRRAYPRSLSSYQKPGTGVWAIDRFGADTVGGLDAASARRLLTGEDPAYLHVKDPNLSPGMRRGEHLLIYCAHPYSWSSSTSGYGRLQKDGSLIDESADFLPRGSTWDVAACRVTCRLPIPAIGAFADVPPVSLYFYDGAECLRPHDTHRRGVSRPRGYSCEEIGGLAYGFDRQFPALHRLSRLAPSFVSTQGTGCHRYVSVLGEEDGSLFAIWEQSIRSRAQPLMAHRLSAARVRRLLA